MSAILPAFLPANLHASLNASLRATNGVAPGSGAHLASKAQRGRLLPPELDAPGSEPEIHSASGDALSRTAPAGQAGSLRLFAKKAAYPSGGAAPTSVVVADLNGDGKADEIVLNDCTSGNNGNCTGPGLVSVLLGNGDGTFQAAKTYGSGGYLAIQVVVADLNGDGKADLAVLNDCMNFGCGGSTDVGSIGILLGNGDGTFQAAASFPSQYFPSSLAAGDVNGDGQVDLVVSYFCDPLGDFDCPFGGIEVYGGNGDGTFKAPNDFSSGGYITRQVLLADMNGDGRPDLVVANCGSPDCYIGTVGVLIGNGDGTFLPAQTYNSGGVLPLAMTIGDVNGDGNPDVVVDHECLNPAFCSAPVVSVLLGNADGSLQPAESYNAGGYACTTSGYCPVSIALADVNGDGKLDVIAPFNVLLGNGDGTFQSPVGYTSDACERGQFTVADLNGDGKPDISIANYYAKNGCGGADVTIFLNVSLAQTTISLVSSVNPALVLQTVTYTATVNSQFIGAVGGSVVFKSGSTVLGSAPLMNGMAALSLQFKTMGPFFISASYSGDVNDAASKSTTVKQVVKKWPTSATVSSSMDPSSQGQPVTFTATINSVYGAVPDGELVIFEDNGVAMVAERLSGGVAQYSIANLTAKTHLIKAVFYGDPVFASSVSVALKQVIVQSAALASPGRE